MVLHLQYTYPAARERPTSKSNNLALSSIHTISYVHIDLLYDPCASRQVRTARFHFLFLDDLLLTKQCKPCPFGTGTVRWCSASSCSPTSVPTSNNSGQFWRLSSFCRAGTSGHLYVPRTPAH